MTDRIRVRLITSVEVPRATILPAAALVCAVAALAGVVAWCLGVLG